LYYTFTAAAIQGNLKINNYSKYAASLCDYTPFGKNQGKFIAKPGIVESGGHDVVQVTP